MPEKKAELRQRLLAARDAMSPFALSQAIADLAEWMYALPVELTEHDTVAAYVATRREPGGIDMLDALIDRGLRVILPIVPAGPPTALNWGRYRDARTLASGRWGLQEPLHEPLGAGEIGTATIILVPAVAVDIRGARLGRGAGYYDRTLAGLDATIVAVVHDDELLDTEVPEEPNDIRVDWILTPSRGFVRTEN